MAHLAVSLMVYLMSKPLAQGCLSGCLALLGHDELVAERGYFIAKLESSHRPILRGKISHRLAPSLAYRSSQLFLVAPSTTWSSTDSMKIQKATSTGSRHHSRIRECQHQECTDSTNQERSSP
ncbi:hypothetical protein AUEXF2481DRAFT_172806 [Aureobasidium subglaciale EXF-2481]|uniref:Secreted protein n=1 Tax=Aureobasidium subglaciale (strain EXF-2481) TaxID=1043005 RepID=A0A074YT92_AURSE|nr:uncharacterized protein AUEXF2481DRAFT_172806 [Aureobasidium subglaciale EXF-2481]KEQ99364.1 hypothetical protein AUEXF2481DRAFT_172806 [Aureobasidium subglaciale EXF-2481]